MRGNSSPAPSRTDAIYLGLGVSAALAALALAISVFTTATSLLGMVVWAVLTVLWLAFAAALVASPGTLDELWRQVRGLPLVIQGLAWLLWFPVMLGLWIWASAWPLVPRLVLVIGLGAWTVVVLFPRGV